MSINPFSLPGTLRGKPEAKYWWIFIAGFVLIGIALAPLLMFPLVFIVGMGRGVPLFNSDLGIQGTMIYIISGIIVFAAWSLVLLLMKKLSRVWFFLLLVGFVVFVLGYLSLSLSFVNTDYIGLAGTILALISYWKISGQKVLPNVPQAS